MNFRIVFFFLNIIYIDINYIEKKKDNTKIHLVNEEIIDSKESLNDLEIKLQSYGFFRIHQSYIVQFISSISMNFDNPLFFITIFLLL